MKIIITRHGQTNWNVLRKIQGQTNIELNDIGKSQAEETANLIKDEKIDLIISSPLKRTIETAEIINKVFNVDIITDNRLMERNYGRLEGITLEELEAIKQNDIIMNNIWNYTENVDINNIETMKTFCDRIYNFFDEIVEKYKDKNILVVTHGGTSVPIKYYFMNIPLENFKDRETIHGLKNCEVIKYII